MHYIDDWEMRRERWSALWQGRALDRPCMTVTAPNSAPSRPHPVPYANPEAKWLDPEYVVSNMLSSFARTWYGGESFPSHLLMAGWIVTHYASRPDFSDETIWFDPVQVDMRQPPDFRLDFNDPWVRKVIALYERVLPVAGRNNFIVGKPCIMAPNDMLALVIGAETCMLAMAEEPAWCRQAILQMTDNAVRAVCFFREKIRETSDFWYGNSGWMPFWAPEPYIATQSDISCMLSTDMYEQFIVPELDRLSAAFGKLWYHLDGQSAFQHLPRLCSLPYIKVIQFTPEAGGPPNGPAFADLYRTVQKAGKIVHINVPAANVEYLCRTLDPGLLCMDISCASEHDGRNLLHAATRWTAASRG